MRINNRFYIKLFSVLAITAMVPVLSAAADFKPVYVSCLVPKGQGCVWLKIGLPDGKKETLAEFPCANYGARVSWKPGLKEAVAWFDPGTYLMAGYGGSDFHLPKPGYKDEEFPNFKSMLYRVDLAQKTIKPVPFPGKATAEPDDIAYTAKGDLAAFDSAGPEPKKQSSDDIDNATARAFRFKKGKWVEFEEKPTTAEECDAAGINALDAVKNVGPRTVQLLEGHSGGDNVEEKAVLRRLKKAQPKVLHPDSGEWTLINTPYGPVYLYDINLGDYAFSSGLFFMEIKGQLVTPPDEGFTGGDVVAVQIRGPYLLVASSNCGCHPRVYDLRTGELVFKSNTARATVFWPDTKKSKDGE